MDGGERAKEGGKAVRIGKAECKGCEGREVVAEKEGREIRGQCESGMGMLLLCEVMTLVLEFGTLGWISWSTKITYFLSFFFFSFMRSEYSIRISVLLKYVSPSKQ